MSEPTLLFLEAVRAETWSRPEARTKLAAISVSEKRVRWKRPVSGTIGHISGKLTAALIGSKKGLLGRGTTKADVVKLLKEHKISNVPSSTRKGAIGLRIHAGHGRPIADIKRMWKRKDIRLPTKLLGTALQPITSAQTALRRADHYNPIAHTVTSYMNDKAIKLHEIGHAMDFSGSKVSVGARTAARMIPGVNVPIILRDEAIASRNAGRLSLRDGKRGQQRKKRDKSLNRKLSAAFGSYVGGTLLGAPLAGLAGGHAVGMAHSPFTQNLKSPDSNKRRQATFDRLTRKTRRRGKK